jgi:cytochrome c oxidase subunit 4
MSHASEHDSSHPSPSRYVGIALILAIVTGVEVWIVYQSYLTDIMVPLLLVLSIGKFAMVVMYFMHLKFDSRLFAILFVGGLLLTLGVLTALFALFSRVYFA